MVFETNRINYRYWITNIQVDFVYRLEVPFLNDRKQKERNYLVDAPITEEE